MESLRLCRLRRATLIVAKLDRLARNVHFITSLMEAGFDFVAVDFPRANRLTVHILAAVAEHEASMISARTKSALAVAEANGEVLGGARMHNWHMAIIAQNGAAASARKRAHTAARRSGDLLPAMQGIQEAGATSPQRIASALNAPGIKPARPEQRSLIHWSIWSAEGRTSCCTHGTRCPGLGGTGARLHVQLDRVRRKGSAEQDGEGP